MNPMKTVFTLSVGSFTWQQFIAVIEKHRLSRLIDTRPVSETRLGRFSREVLERALPDLFESWMNLCPFEAFEKQAVTRELRALLDASFGARIALLNGSHLVTLARELGWHCFSIAPDAKLTEDLGFLQRGETCVKAPAAAHIARRAAGASLRALHSRF
jgi:hypothetical protein